MPSLAHSESIVEHLIVEMKPEMEISAHCLTSIRLEQVDWTLLAVEVRLEGYTSCLECVVDAYLTRECNMNVAEQGLIFQRDFVLEPPLMNRYRLQNQHCHFQRS